ncbi:FAD-dependent thymidylate synthase [Oceanobacillus neutriphilus]|uniref:FAD-dependent thymidylate synthase n=1 Tax=Oceanobacillus neutriphilus TaxID=531815 RepID=A0ABQ2NYK7_9BACI|nr:FAD-dependent thymidylate synthase [Oceanobacillus neutriphilus]GGP13520.1 hypothetical protein GCM10011346_33840 [Oceanobacillus neutriphilus]
MSNRVNVLDKGYIILHETMGDDRTVANAARVSYDKRTEELSEKDERLIKFLAREGHTSPFRHATLQFEIYMPLMVARQLWKYVVGSDHTMDAWNESSRRYITEEPTFYIPQAGEWRSAPADSKQGSGDLLPVEQGELATRDLESYIATGEMYYKRAIDSGVAPEQARLFLPAYGMYVRSYWTASLQSVAHFLNQRLEADAQAEIQVYAEAVRELAIEKFPVSLAELLGEEKAPEKECIDYIQQSYE